MEVFFILIRATVAGEYSCQSAHSRTLSIGVFIARQFGLKRVHFSVSARVDLPFEQLRCRPLHECITIY